MTDFDIDIDFTYALNLRAVLRYFCQNYSETTPFIPKNPQTKYQKRKATIFQRCETIGIELLFSIMRFSSPATKSEKVIFIQKSNVLFNLLNKIGMKNEFFELDEQSQSETAETVQTETVQAETAQNEQPQIITFSDMITAQIALITHAQKNFINPERETKTLEILFGLKNELTKFVHNSNEFQKALEEKTAIFKAGNEMQRDEIRRLRRKLRSVVLKVRELRERNNQD